jgi:hypothetical protein
MQGWHADPFGLHEMRYFSAGQATKLVRDGRLESYDEPPTDGMAAESAAGFGGRPELAGAGSATASYAADDARRGAAASYARRRRRGLEYGVVAAGAVIAVLTFVAIVGGSPAPRITSAAFVTKAAQQTLGQSTADVTVSGTARIAGQAAAISGNGQVDFATGATSINIAASATTGSMTESELVVGGNLYLQVTVDGRSLASVTGGRHWLQIPIAQSASQTVTDGSPASAMSLLSQQGASVTALAPRNINGQTCDGYTVTPSKAAMLASAQAEYARMGLSQAETSAAMQALQDMTPPTITAWFDSERQLACRMTIDMQIGTPTSAGANTEQAQMVMTFLQYGVPVQVTAPAAADTISIAQLGKLGSP